VAGPDRLDDAVGIGREAGVLVVTREDDRNRLVLRFFEEAHDTMPVPSDTAGARNETKVVIPALGTCELGPESSGRRPWVGG
jgi:hypothetical protein